MVNISTSDQVQRVKRDINLNSNSDINQYGIEHVTVVEDWTAAEERALVRKLDLRVLFPCCIVYFLAYLDRANMGFVNILQEGTSDSFTNSLKLHGTEFNWVRMLPKNYPQILELIISLSPFQCPILWLLHFSSRLTCS
jgi:hypothetical protein